MRIGPVLNTLTTFLAGLHSKSLDTIETESPKLFLGTHQWRFVEEAVSFVKKILKAR